MEGEERGEGHHYEHLCLKEDGCNMSTLACGSTPHITCGVNGWHPNVSFMYFLDSSVGGVAKRSQRTAASKH